jgi:hypothetical protein
MPTQKGLISQAEVHLARGRTLMEASEKVAILLSDRPQPVFRAIIGDSAARSAAVRRGGIGARANS